MSKQVTPVWGQDYDRGFVGFSNCPGNLISRGITFFENLEESMKFGSELLGGGISHVFLVWDRNWGIESAENGVQKFNLQARIDDPDLMVVFREPVAIEKDPNYLHELLTYAESLEKRGMKYDYTGLVGYILKVLSPLHHIFPALNKLPVPMNMGGEFCSAYISDDEKHTSFYKRLQLFKENHVTRISPNALWNCDADCGPENVIWKSLRFDKYKQKEVLV